MMRIAKKIKIQRADKAMVKIGDIEIEGYRTTTGKYFMGKGAMLHLAGLDEVNAPHRDTNHLKSSLLSVDGAKIVGYPIGVVASFLHFQADRGNKTAESVFLSLLQDSLSQRLENAR